MTVATKHSSQCSRVFKNYDMTCPRCIELSNGASARQGWQADYFSRKAFEAEQRSKAIKAHYRADGSCKCGVVCTAFEW